MKKPAKKVALRQRRAAHKLRKRNLQQKEKRK